MPSINVKFTDKEKKKLDIAKAKSDKDNWREFFLSEVFGGDFDENDL